MICTVPEFILTTVMKSVARIDGIEWHRLNVELSEMSH